MAGAAMATAADARSATGADQELSNKRMLAEHRTEGTATGSGLDRELLRLDFGLHATILLLPAVHILLQFTRLIGQTPVGLMASSCAITP